MLFAQLTLAFQATSASTVTFPGIVSFLALFDTFGASGTYSLVLGSSDRQLVLLLVCICKK